MTNPEDPTAVVQHSGRVALIGRPNAGKSTLMNQLLGEKVAIVSDKPQTTRQRIVGIHTEERGQIIFLDTPGVHKPMYRLNRQMVRVATDALSEADVVCLMVDISVKFGTGDERMLEMMKSVACKRLVVLNKVDLVKKHRLLPIMEQYAQTGLFAEIVPVSALAGDGTALLLDLLFRHLPEALPTEDPELLTPHTERFLAAEIVREKILAVCEDEIPFATAVRVERWEEDEPRGLVRIYAAIVVERPGQKKIVVGAGGSMIKAIGIAARADLEPFLDKRVHLDLHVRVEPGWRDDPAALAEIDRDGTLL